MPKGFYVYELVDPRTGLAFYVGKGKGRRAWVHEAAASNGRERNGLKAEVLGQIQRAGLTVDVRIVQDGLSEDVALRLERSMIVLRHAELTNIALGNRSPMEVVRAAARNDLATIKPLCALIREGADAPRLRVWQQVVGGLSRLARAA